MPIGHAIAVAARLAARRGARQRSRAFSLAELLLTVGLIGLLMSIMLPALKRSVRQAKATVCRHNLRAIDQMMQMYRMESRGWLPHVPESDPATDAGPKPWFDQLVPRYLNDVALLVCPEDPYHTILERNARANPHPDWANASSYGMSEFILGSPDSYLAHLDRHSPRRPLDTIVLADMGPDRVASGGAAPRIGLDRNRGRLRWDDDYDYGVPDARQSWLTQRHGQSINVLTLGGDVRVMGTAE